MSATALSKEVGVSQATLSRWLVAAGSVDDVSKRKLKGSRRANRWPVAEKLRVITAAQGLEGEVLGALLRKEGIHMVQLTAWRTAVEQALDSRAVDEAEAERERELTDLRRELALKDKALAEAAARLVLRKKLSALWGDEDDDMAPTSELSSPRRSRKP